MNQQGLFGQYGGSYLPPELETAMANLAHCFAESIADPEFNEELTDLYRQYIGRPNPLYYARNLTRELGGARIYLKREDLNHTGAHKINNTVGQSLLARRMGMKRIIAETGAGQHGVATATAAALFGQDCTIYMGEVDTQRQALNVSRMELLGAKVVPVTAGTRTLKDAVDAAIADLAANPRTYYMLGSAVGPHPYPTIVRYFQAIIGREAREQILCQQGRLPDCIIACVGGGSNAIGLFSGFLEDSETRIIGVEPAGRGLATGEHAASLTAGKPGVLHGFRCYLLSDEQGDPLPTYSVAAGLDYPGVGPEHCALKDSGRADYVTVDDGQALAAFHMLSRCEGIIPALESAHAIAYAAMIAPTLNPDRSIIVNLSGRGDKDVDQVTQLLAKRS